MNDAPRMFTSRHRAIHDFSKSGLSPGFVPVRISLGLPKFIPDAHAWPYIKELAPVGAFNAPADEFRTRYLDRLNRIGTERIEHRLRGVAANYPDQSLALLCFEDVTVNGCHRTMFADWWEAETGEHVEERNASTDLPVSGWHWNGSAWVPNDAADRLPAQLSLSEANDE